jgi:hypothetical protein
MSSGPASAIAARDRLAAARPTSRAPGAPSRIARRIAAGSSLRGLSSVTIDHVGEPRRDRAHLGALAGVAVAAGAEDDDQPALGVRPERLDRRLDRVGRVRIIDIDRRAGAGDHRPLEPAAHRLDPAEIGERRRDLAAGGDDEAGGGQRIGRLIGADQRQVTRGASPRPRSSVSGRAGSARASTNFSVSPRAPTVITFSPRAAQRRDHLVRLRIVHPETAVPPGSSTPRTAASWPRNRPSIVP